MKGQKTTLGNESQSKFLRIKEMPKNANGKIDRKALQTIYKDL